VRLAFTGDVSFHNDVSAGAFSFLADELSCPLFVNYESVLTDVGQSLVAARDKVLLSSPADRLRLLTAFDVKLVSLANNHLGDYGNEAAERTISRCSAAFATFGAGVGHDAFHRHVLESDGLRVAFVAYCMPDSSPLLSTGERIGPRAWSEDTWRSDLAWSRDAGDCLVVVMHWGEVHTHCPRPDQIALGRSLVESGADLVVGSHPHAVQGYERYRNKYIFYSLGNFFFPDVRVEVNGRLIEKRNLRRNRWGLVPVMDLGSGGADLVELKVVRDTSTIPRFEDGSKWRRRVERFSSWIASGDVETIYHDAWRRDRRSKRMEEFCVRNLGRLGVKPHTVRDPLP
jgi:poly-gamma-glutamate capsule biosynthesis protein CapA/YwtB (metallophosphatase superfamily)